MGVWTHDVRRTRFCLCVDDFGVRYFTKKDANYLLDAIGSQYKYTTDWKGRDYCGLSLEWEYAKGYVKYQKGSPTSKLCSLQRPPTLSPLSCAGVLHTESSATNDGTCRHHTPPLSQRSSLSSVNDGDASLLWESLGVLDPSALNDISREQENPTISTMCRATRLLDYVATYPNTCQ